MKSAYFKYTVCATLVALSLGSTSALARYDLVPGLQSNNRLEITSDSYTLNGQKIDQTMSYENVYGGFSQNGQNVTNNSVIIDVTNKETWASTDGLTIYNTIAGGYSNTGDVIGNSLTIKSKYVSPTVKPVILMGYVYGGKSDSGNVRNNNLWLERFKPSNLGRLILNQSGSGEVTGNHVTLYMMEFESGVVAAQSDANVAKDNVLTVYGYRHEAAGSGIQSILNKTSYGAIGGVAAIKNQVYIKEYSHVDTIVGGYSNSGLAQENLVQINGEGAFVDTVYGGQSLHGTVDGNIVEVIKGQVHTIYGGASGDLSLSGGAVTSNTVKLNNPDSTGSVVYGGFGRRNDVIGNRVEFNQGAVSLIYGGFGQQLVSKNQVLVTGGTAGALYGGVTVTDKAIENQVIFDLGDGSYSGNAFGGSTAGGQASCNQVIVNSGTINGNLYGAQGTLSFSSDIPENEPGYGETAPAPEIIDGNEVIIKGGTVNGNIYGAYAVGDAHLYNNKVIIEGGTVNGNIYASFHNGQLAANGNRIILRAGNLSGATLVGNHQQVSAVLLNGQTSDVTSNILEIDGFSGVVNRVTGFDQLIFTNINLTSSVLTSDQPILSINHASQSDLDGMKISVYKIVVDEDVDLGNGTRFSLINVQNSGEETFQFDFDEETKFAVFKGGTLVGTGQLTSTSQNASGEVSVSRPDPDGVPSTPPEDVEVPSVGDDQESGNGDSSNGGAGSGTDSDGGNGNGNGGSNNGGGVDVEISDVRLNPQTQLVARTRAATVAFINQGTDLVSDKLDTLHASGQMGLQFFGSVYGNSNRYDVASDLDIQGMSAILGWGYQTQTNMGDLTLNAFFEHATGDLKTNNRFATVDFKGQGNVSATGGGVAARWYPTENTWLEAGARLGRVKTDMDNALMDGHNTLYGYESKSLYYGLHLGIGRHFALNTKTSLELGAKYFFTTTQADEFNVGSDAYHFDQTQSHRARAMSRVNYAIADTFLVLVGAAYEHEFAGDANMNAAGLSAKTESIQGGTFLGEFGFSLLPEMVKSVQVDGNVRGYLGQREGVSGSVHVTFKF